MEAKASSTVIGLLQKYLTGEASCRAPTRKEGRRFFRVFFSTKKKTFSGACFGDDSTSRTATPVPLSTPLPSPTPPPSLPRPTPLPPPSHPPPSLTPTPTRPPPPSSLCADACARPRWRATARRALTHHKQRMRLPLQMSRLRLWLPWVPPWRRHPLFLWRLPAGRPSYSLPPGLFLPSPPRTWRCWVRGKGRGGRISLSCAPLLLFLFCRGDLGLRLLVACEGLSGLRSGLVAAAACGLTQRLSAFFWCSFTYRFAPILCGGRSQCSYWSASLLAHPRCSPRPRLPHYRRYPRRGGGSLPRL